LGLAIIFGVSVDRDRKTFTIHTFQPKGVKKGFTTKDFQFVSEEENGAEKWVIQLRDYIKNGIGAGKPLPRKLLVLINPFSGKKKAQKIWNKIQPIFVQAGVEIETIVTEYLGHAIKITRNYDLKSIDGIATVSGDGMLHEVLNGFMERPDWEEAIKTPVILIPAGSGNAMASCFGYYDPYTAAWIMLKGGFRKMDGFSIKQKDQPRRFAFLSVSWAVIADVDLGSEKFRWAGAARFSAATVQKIISLKFQKARVKYLLSDEKRDNFTRCHRLEERCKKCSEIPNLTSSTETIKQPDTTSPKIESKSSPDTIERKPLERIFTEITLPVRILGVEPTKEEKEKEETENKDEAMEAANDKATEQALLEAIDKEKQAEQNESNVKQEKPEEIVKSTVPVKDEPKESIKNESKGKEKVEDNPPDTVMRYGPPFTVPDDVLENTPEGWKLDESEFFLFLVTNLPWISSDVLSSPYAHFSDGNLDLLLTRKSSNISRSQALSIFTKLDSGGHVEAREVEYAKIKAFTLEPLEKEGYISIDGEKAPFVPLVAQVHPNLFLLMCLPPIPKLPLTQAPPK